MFELVKKLKNLCKAWKKIAQKIINSWKFCQLFFKKGQFNINLYKNYNYQDKVFAKEKYNTSNYLQKVMLRHIDSPTAKKNLKKRI